MQSAIKSFSIKGLFGTKNVHLPFDDNPVKVLIGANGSGKTHTLSMLYYTLKGNFYRLNQFRFDTIELELFTKNSLFNTTSIVINKKDLDETVKQIYKQPIVKEVLSKIGIAEFERLLSKYGKSNKKWDFEDELDSKYRKMGMPSHMIFRAIEEVKREEKLSDNTYIKDLKEKINQNMDNSLLIYFPTYRRIEETSQSLGYEDNENELEDTKIQFGMEDVRKRFRNIENQIDELLKNAISEISYEILNQVFDEDDESAQDDNIISMAENDIAILFARVGSKIAEAKKQKIKELLSSGNFSTRDSSLKFMLKKLIEVYGKQKDIDKSVTDFRDVCNKYLVEKVVFYDESTIKIQIKSTITGEQIALTSLSSGEKQIVAIFAKIYLSDRNRRYTIIFDEPELSLSIYWQENLLPDIIKSGNVSLLLAATHSPAIYSNQKIFDCTFGMNDFTETITSKSAV